MKTLACVLVETGRPLELADLEIPALRPGQVLVEVRYSGVCHTQVLEARGRRGVDRFLPHCLGHEASGFVLETGPEVQKVQVGCPVVLSWISGSGANVPSTTYRWGDLTVNAGAITTFSRLAVISENRLSPSPPGLPLDLAALLGCAVPTGAGAVWNTAQARSGQSLAVFGTGGVGLCAVAAAATAGCNPVVAVDLHADRLRLAQRLGATHVIDASTGDATSELGSLVPGGLDLAIEASGRCDVMERALCAVRPQGGVAVVAGNAPFGERFSFDPRQLNLGKRLLGTWGGDSQPDRDMPGYGRWLESRPELRELLSPPYALHDINLALDDLEQGKVIRPLIDMNLA